MTRPSNQAVDCPSCRAENTKVIATYYTVHGEIVRKRQCRECSFRFETIATAEEVLDRKLYKVNVPVKRTPEYAQKICTLERLT
nr:hypothetical protein 5 [bacterium]